MEFSLQDQMKLRRVFYLVPANPNAGLTSMSLGLFRALDRQGLPVGFFKPIRQPTETGKERSTHFLRATGISHPIEPLSFHHAQDLLKSGKEGRLLQDVVELFEKGCSNEHHANSVFVVEGLQPTAEQPELDHLNHLIIKALNAEVIIVSNLPKKGTEIDLETFQDRLREIAFPYGGLEDSNVLGCIINKYNAPESPFMKKAPTLDPLYKDPTEILKKCEVFHGDCSLLGVIPWDFKISSPRTSDLAEHLGAYILNEGEIKTRRVTSVKIVARSIKHMIGPVLQPGTFVITPGDRDDIILAVCMAAINGVPFAGLALTGDYEPDKNVLNLCEMAFKTGLPLLLLSTDSFESAAHAASIDMQVAIDDIERIENIMDYTAERLDISPLLDRIKLVREPRLSPAAFMYMLANLARQKKRRIVLPEGTEPRIIRAAAICHERNIAQCVLIGDPTDIRRLADVQGITLPDDLEIVNPDHELRMNYVEPMVALRKHKGLTSPSAFAQLEDVTVLGTMMLAVGEVDGLVSGAVHSTANTVRPALQLIKTRSDSKLISSIFFMCLPNQVLIYGDCAINPDPNAEELADIALQSAASAESFGIEPRIAMLSYSTGSSGKGCDVEKVREATRIAQERRPDLLIDGPMQYDAACTAEVAMSKAPNSKVAGRATVLVFPDLNTGNTTYKAVQRTANVVAVGPMLQGLRRPVNDLSRGALVDDIVYTIALTAIQADKAESVTPAVSTKVPPRNLKRTNSLPSPDSSDDLLLLQDISMHDPCKDLQEPMTVRDHRRSMTSFPVVKRSDESSLFTAMGF
ncbi:unnamed protein product [Cylindrotheca closterium]|uniref:Phosphate acetyltransferase n=1 Tax=Cylindrotheca closterium TaxID=2856 RepID=A0AAD2FYS4_9STRA|nr:unnamed protein product [Cylindrotheca closterium]